MLIIECVYYARDIEALWRTFVAQQDSFAVSKVDLVKIMSVIKDPIGGEYVLQCTMDGQLHCLMMENIPFEPCLCPLTLTRTHWATGSDPTKAYQECAKASEGLFDYWVKHVNTVRSVPMAG